MLSDSIVWSVSHFNANQEKGTAFNTATQLDGNVRPSAPIYRCVNCSRGRKKKKPRLCGKLEAS